MNPTRIVSICLGVIAIVGVLALGFAPSPSQDSGDSPVDVPADMQPLPTDDAGAGDSAAAAAAAASDFEGWVDSAPADEMPVDEAPADEGGDDASHSPEGSGESAPENESSDSDGMSGDEMPAIG